MRTTTDSNGYFSIDAPKERRYHYWFLRFIDREHLDTVKYLPPDDVEITQSARRGRVATVTGSIRFHPQWAEVELRISQVGGEKTPRGKVLRALGLPEKQVAVADSDGEEWWYFTHGVVYAFRGGAAASMRRFDPVQPPPGVDRRVSENQ